MPSTLRQGRTDAAERLIKASPAAIYQAFVDPSALMQWLPPEGMSGRVLEFDPRTGGRYRIELAYEVPAPAAVAKTTERTDISEGRFLALEPGRRIVQSVEFVSTDPAFAGVMVMTWSLETAGDGTRVTITAENVPHGISKEDHDAGLYSRSKTLPILSSDRGGRRRRAPMEETAVEAIGRRGRRARPRSRRAGWTGNPRAALRACPLWESLQHH